MRCSSGSPKPERLAGAGAGLADDVVALEGQREGQFLDREWVDDPTLAECGVEVVVQPEVSEEGLGAQLSVVLGDATTSCERLARPVDAGIGGRARVSAGVGTWQSHVVGRRGRTRRKDCLRERDVHESRCTGRTTVTVPGGQRRRVGRLAHPPPGGGDQRRRRPGRGRRAGRRGRTMRRRGIRPTRRVVARAWAPAVGRPGASHRTDTAPRGVTGSRGTGSGRPTRPVSSASSRSAASLTESSPASMCPPGCTH